ncbi:MAG: hypothetical protein EOO13_00280 [Chitinophagaceae bacterium]|nr:MAG: hypothetical protein EOO13_00280 [Chitinophagaceae bacterium]
MKFFIAATVLLLLTGFIFRSDISTFISGIPQQETKKKAGKKGADVMSEVSVKQKWELPAVLIEVSGIAYLDAQRFACVQDEAGTIYIYNVSTAKIEKEIPFASPGDFEGISLKGNTAYIVRSDGVIFEVDMLSKKTTEYNTFLTAADNVETLFYQAAGNRLLVAGKEPDKQAPEMKNIYAFDLTNKSLQKTPIAQINLNDRAFSATGKSTKKKKGFMPSGIAVNPVDNDLYILDGPRSRLLVATLAGDVKKVYELGNEFYKPEGISFSPAGDLYISNEGKKIPGNILQVTLN